LNKRSRAARLALSLFSVRRHILHYPVEEKSRLARGVHRFALEPAWWTSSWCLPLSFTEVFAMIYELRKYQAIPGQMAKLLTRFRDELPPIWEKHGIRAIGFWTTLVGESSSELIYMLQWESLADLETRWTAFLNDPAWHKVRDDSERDGPIVANISNQLLTPTAFSALK
jgi:hypothetical protein